MVPGIKTPHARLDQMGIRTKMLSVSRMKELKEDFGSRIERRELDESFYKERLTFFSFEKPSDFKNASSLIVIAIPRPQTRVLFGWKGRVRTLILPPTYVGYRRVKEETLNLVNEVLASGGFRAVSSKLPEKLISVRSGLAEYGRNNICYVPGLGSFFEPMVFFTDLPCAEETWLEPRMMEACNTCRSCMKRCPTGAISEDRFLLRAERCIVYHNERPAEYPFPEWLDLSGHDCLVGCMECQKYCPVDRQLLDWYEDGEEFSEDETSMIYDGIALELLPEETVRKLERLELVEYYPLLPRNLQVLLQNEETYS